MFLGIDVMGSAPWSGLRIGAALLILILGILLAWAIPVLNIDSTARVLDLPPTYESDESMDLANALRTFAALAVLGFATFILIGR